MPAEGVRTTMRFAVAPDGRLGLRAARSHDVVTIDHCLVAHPAIDALLDVVTTEGVDEVTIRVGAATGESAAWSTPDDAGVVHEVVAGHRLQVSAGSFFQASLDRGRGTRGRC